MGPAEVVWWRILGVLLLLLGLVLFAGPRIDYTGTQHIPHTDYEVTSPKTLVIPRTVAALIFGAGVLALVFAGKGSRRS